MKIDDLTFFCFAHNLLNKDDMAITAKTIRETGEGNAVLQTCIAHYMTNTSLAEDIIGPDLDIMVNQDNVLHENEKNVCLKDRNMLYAHSKEANQTNKSNMTNMNLTKEEQQNIQTIVADFNKSSVNAEELSIEEKLVKFYLEQLPGSFPEDAYKVVKDMSHGIESFNANLQKALKEGGFNYAEELSKLAIDKSIKEKYELYANFLAALQTLEVSNLSEEQLTQIEDFTNIRGKLNITGEVNEEMLANLETQIADMLNNNTLCLGSLDQLRHLIEELPNGTDAMNKVTHDAEEDMHQKLIASMATYIAYRKDGIESMRGTEWTAEAIAISVAAGVEQAQVISDLHEGRTTVDKAIKTLKIIGGIALFSLLAYMSLGFMVLSNSVLSICLMQLIGASTFAALGTITATILFSIALGDVLVNAGSKIMSLALRTFDLIIDTWRKTAYPAIYSTLERVWQWLKTQLNNNTIQQTQTNSDAVQQVSE